VAAWSVIVMAERTEPDRYRMRVQKQGGRPCSRLTSYEYSNTGDVAMPPLLT